jgi:hypothetical protein
MQSDPITRSKGFLEAESRRCSSMRHSTLILFSPLWWARTHFCYTHFVSEIDRNVGKILSNQTKK